MFIRSTQHAAAATSATKLPADEKFFRYTSGRWLWNEQARLEERYRRFNVPELQRIAASCVGAQRCMSIFKLAEGGFNKVFRLVMDNSAVVIARTPHFNTEASAHAVASEVATMDFASTILGIPTPKVLLWSANADNSVGAEYVLMEEATGTQLSESWESLEIDEKAQVVDQLVALEKKLLSVSFSIYGNICFADQCPPGCQTVEITGLPSHQMKTHAESRHVIGPAVESSFWDGERKDFEGIRGPWQSVQEYIKAIAIREIKWLSEHANPAQHDKPFEPESQKLSTSHITQYRKLLAAANYLLPENSELVRPTLWHWDLHSPNIFTTDGEITALIDWQDCSVGSLIFQAQIPRLVNYEGERILELPPGFKDLEDSDEKRQLQIQVEKSLLLYVYESSSEKENPILKTLSQLPHRNTITDTILFAAGSWDTGILPLRQCLIRLYRHWKEICPKYSCPFEITQDELEQHFREGEGFNENADFWDSISDFVTRDGFVLPEDYDRAMTMFAELREQGLRTFEGEERANFELATRWAAKRC